MIMVFNGKYLLLWMKSDLSLVTQYLDQAHLAQFH